MLKNIDYNELEHYFTLPKMASPFYNYRKLPRKKKKMMAKFLNAKHMEHLTLNQKLWYMLEFTNPNYKRFLIKMIIANEKS